VLKIKNNVHYLAIAILIGGKSSRFGSDKGLFKFKGKSLISYQLEVLDQLNYDIFLVANSKQQVQNYINNINYQKISGFIIDDYDLISDQSIHTPMLGLYTTFKDLNNLKYEKVFILPCDNPYLKIKVLKYMIKESKSFDCSIPQWNNGFLEPLFAIYPVNKAFLKARENILKNILKLVSLLDKSWKINYISIENSLKFLDENLSSFININNPSDIENLV
jgi:molybdopterin-guanine dinucleotide biosynthesis protein A